MILLDSKISVPQLPSRMVPRRRLLQGLEEALHRKLTLISAPAGSGKTTLLSEWILSRQHQLKVAWLSLGKTENEPYRFWRYFLAALEPLIKKDLSNFLNREQIPTPDDFEELIEKIDLGIPDPFVVVLDDFHLISNGSVHNALTYLLDYLPPQMHIVVPAAGKAQAVREAVLGPVSTECPASILRQHPNAHMYVDTDAASLLLRKMRESSVLVK